MSRYPTNPDTADVLAMMLGRISNLETRDQTGPFCRLGGSSATMPNNTITPYAWSITDDPYDMVVAGVPTLPVRGWWRIMGAGGFAAGAGGVRMVRLRINGADIRDTGPLSMDGGGVLPVHDLFPCEEGDEIELCGFQTSGGSLDAIGGGFLSVEWAHNRWD